MKSPDAKVISVDFDGVIVEECWPEIGPLMLGAVEGMRQLDRAGYWLIINTCRAGEHEADARIFMHYSGIPFDAFNENLPHRTAHYGEDCRKISADLYIDDRNLGGFPGWSAVLTELMGMKIVNKHNEEIPRVKTAIVGNWCSFSK